MKCLIVTALLMVIPSLIVSENVFLLDITPEEAQKYIAAQSLDVNYARKLGEKALPVTKDDDGDFIYQGRKIENPSEYTEEEYLASQYHGQDGLGRYRFGYTDWNQGRAEAGNANGEVRGTYKYVDPRGNDFIVNYWADSLGFHHEDNRPKVVLEPVTDTPEVQAARAEHFRKWNEIAEQSRLNPDPNSDIYNRNANRYDEDQSQINQALELIGGQRDHKAAGSEQTAATALNPEKEGQYVPKTYWTPDPNEPTGPPHGFFYSFDYPVQLLVDHNEARKLRTLEGSSHTAEKRETSDTELPQGKHLGDVATAAAVHDPQVSPRQKSELNEHHV